MKNKIYVLGDIVDTTAGLKFVQASLSLTLEGQNRILHWFHNENGDDELLWDHELDKILTKHLTPSDYEIDSKEF